MRSPGRPDPSRVVQRQFWRLIATGVTTVEASLAVGVSWPVGTRWFRHAGGMPPISLDEPSGRYLSFEEREEIAILRAQGKGVREIAGSLGRNPGTISRELRRNAATIRPSEIRTMQHDQPAAGMHRVVLLPDHVVARDACDARRCRPDCAR